MKVENSVSAAEAVKQSKLGINLLQGSQKNGSPEKTSKAEGSDSSQQTTTTTTTTPPPASTTPTTTSPMSAVSTTPGEAAEEASKAPEVTTKQPGDPRDDLKENPEAKGQAKDVAKGKAQAGDGKAAVETTTMAPGGLEDQEENSAEDDDE